jgi:hypothetical protein
VVSVLFVFVERDSFVSSFFFLFLPFLLAAAPALVDPPIEMARSSKSPQAQSQPPAVVDEQPLPQPQAVQNDANNNNNNSSTRTGRKKRRGQRE